ncbi:MAG TPA: hypothetical protein VHP14_25560 [Anaerolineales bacterium]|nr:hypothetical protein [Anaerolineales bacterium]
MSSCVQTQNIQIPTFTEVASSAIPSQSLPPKVLFTETPTPAKTLDPFAATFSAQFATSKARKAATRTAAYATLASRSAVCEGGYNFGFFAEDVLREIDFYKTNKGESWTVVKCLPEKSNLLSGHQEK